MGHTPPLFFPSPSHLYTFDCLLFFLLKRSTVLLPTFFGNLCNWTLFLCYSFITMFICFNDISIYSSVDFFISEQTIRFSNISPLIFFVFFHNNRMLHRHLHSSFPFLNLWAVSHYFSVHWFQPQECTILLMLFLTFFQLHYLNKIWFSFDYFASSYIFLIFCDFLLYFFKINGIIMFSLNVEFYELNGVCSINFHFGQICFVSSCNIHIFTLYDFHGEVSLYCMRIQLFTSFFWFPSPFLLLSTGHFLTHLLTNDPSF